MISVHGLTTKPGRDQLISYLDMDINFFMKKHINCYFLKLQMNCSYYTSGRPDFTNRTEISYHNCVYQDLIKKAKCTDTDTETILINGKLNRYV